MHPDVTAKDFGMDQKKHAWTWEIEKSVKPRVWNSDSPISRISFPRNIWRNYGFLQFNHPIEKTLVWITSHTSRVVISKVSVWFSYLPSAQTTSIEQTETHQCETIVFPASFARSKRAGKQVYKFKRLPRTTKDLLINHNEAYYDLGTTTIILGVVAHGLSFSWLLFSTRLNDKFDVADHSEYK